MALVLEDFGQLAQKFEEAAIYQYAAMCQLGMAKCQSYLHDPLGDCHATLRAARLYLKAHGDSAAAVTFKTLNNEYREAAIHCYAQAVDKCPDDGVLKAAIIRELIPLQPHYQGTSTFNSPAHRIHEMVTAIDSCILDRCDHFKALQLVDDIVDNIYERKQSSLYMDLLKVMEINRVLLLVAMSPPPARQTPAHLQIFEHYLKVANFETDDNQEKKRGMDGDDNCWRPGQVLSFAQQCDLAEIVVSWHQHRNDDLRISCQEFLHLYPSLNESQHYLLKYIIRSVSP